MLRLGAEEGSATDGGRQTPAKLDYASLMGGDRRHSLPPPFFLSAYTHIHTQFQTSHLVSINWMIFILFKSSRFERQRPPKEHYYTDKTGRTGGTMYYSNYSQDTLSIIYVDFLIMAGEKEAGTVFVPPYPHSTIHFSNTFLLFEIDWQPKTQTQLLKYILNLNESSNSVDKCRQCLAFLKTV